MSDFYFVKGLLKEESPCERLSQLQVVTSPQSKSTNRRGGDLQIGGGGGGRNKDEFSCLTERGGNNVFVSDSKNLLSGLN